MEQIAFKTGYDEALVGLTAFTDISLPHLVDKYNEGFRQGRVERAARFGARDRKCGKPEKCPEEFRLQETRNGYKVGYDTGSV